MLAKKMSILATSLALTFSCAEATDAQKESAAIRKEISKIEIDTLDDQLHQLNIAVDHPSFTRNQIIGLMLGIKLKIEDLKLNGDISPRALSRLKGEFWDFQKENPQIAFEYQFTQLNDELSEFKKNVAENLMFEAIKYLQAEGHHNNAEEFIKALEKVDLQLNERLDELNKEVFFLGMDMSLTLKSSIPQEEYDIYEKKLSQLFQNYFITDLTSRIKFYNYTFDYLVTWIESHKEDNSTTNISNYYKLLRFLREQEENLFEIEEEMDIVLDEIQEDFLLCMDEVLELKSRFQILKARKAQLINNKDMRILKKLELPEKKLHPKLIDQEIPR